MSDSLLFALALAAGLSVAGVLLIRRGGFPYRPAGLLLTRAEAVFLFELERAVQREHRVFAKTRIADLVTVKRGGTGKASIVALNRIAAKHVDFVLTTPETLVPVAAIELDDASHQRPDRVRRDAFVDRVFAATGIPLIRVRASARHDVEELRRRVQDAIRDRRCEKPGDVEDRSREIRWTESPTGARQGPRSGKMPYRARR